MNKSKASLVELDSEFRSQWIANHEAWIQIEKAHDAYMTEFNEFIMRSIDGKKRTKKEQLDHDKKNLIDLEKIVMTFKEQMESLQKINSEIESILLMVLKKYAEIKKESNINEFMSVSEELNFNQKFEKSRAFIDDVKYPLQHLLENLYTSWNNTYLDESYRIKSVDKKVVDRHSDLPWDLLEEISWSFSKGTFKTVEEFETSLIKYNKEINKKFKLNKSEIILKNNMVYIGFYPSVSLQSKNPAGFTAVELLWGINEGFYPHLKNTNSFFEGLSRARIDESPVFYKVRMGS